MHFLWHSVYSSWCDVLGWMANGPQKLSGVTHTCNTTTVGRVWLLPSQRFTPSWPLSVLLEPQYLMDMVVSVSQLNGQSFYVQLKRDNLIHRAFTLPLARDPFTSQLHRCGITCQLTFNVSPPSPPSWDISRPICLWLHVPVRLRGPSFKYHIRTALLCFIIIFV